LYFQVCFYLGIQITAIKSLELGQKAWDVTIRVKMAKTCISASAYIALINTRRMQEERDARLHCRESVVASTVATVSTSITHFVTCYLYLSEETVRIALKVLRQN